MTTQGPQQSRAREPGEDDAPSYLESDEPRAAQPLALRPEPAPLARPEAPPAPVVRQQPVQTGVRTTDETGALYQALALAQMGFGDVLKKRDNLHFKSKYANLSDVTEAIMPALKAQGLIPMQIPMGDRVYVRIVHGPSGQWIEGGLPLALPDRGSDVQRMGSAITYVRRYLLCMMLGIVAQDEDDDGEAAQHGRRPAA